MMKKIIIAIAAIAAMGCGATTHREQYRADWEDLNTYPQAQWLGEDKFGMYFHWNYNSFAGESGWYGRYMYNPESKVYAHHKAKYGDPADFGYKDFEPMFTAEGFNAREWVENVENCGGKFMVGMAVHHDGFDLYDSSYTSWNSVDKLPHIDIIGELEREARIKNMKFGATTHLAWNWQYFSKFMYPDKYDAAEAPELYNLHDPEGHASAEFAQEWYNRTAELINNYKLDFLWFDFGTQDKAFCDSLTCELTAYYYNKSLEWDKQVAMASKFGFENKKSRVIDCEQGKFGFIKQPLWMSDCTMNEGWFYTGDIAANNTEATGKYWTHQLIDIVSKNGTLLLNVGPLGSGAWPDYFKNELFEMGDWLKINGEAIYNTKPWHRYGEGPNHYGDGSHYNLGETLTGSDIRFTRKGDALYAIVCGWSDGNVVIRSLGADDIRGINIKKVSYLPTGETLAWDASAEALRVTLPAGVDREQYAYALKIEGEGLFPSRGDEYAFVEIPTNVDKARRVRITLNGKGALALSEVICFNRNHSIKKLTPTSSSVDINAPLANLIDGNANETSTVGTIAKTLSEHNPYIDVEFGYAQELTRMQIFPAQGYYNNVVKNAVVEVFDKDNNVIFKTRLNN